MLWLSPKLDSLRGFLLKRRYTVLLYEDTRHSALVFLPRKHLIVEANCDVSD